MHGLKRAAALAAAAATIVALSACTTVDTRPDADAVGQSSSRAGPTGPTSQDMLDEAAEHAARQQRVAVTGFELGDDGLYYVPGGAVGENTLPGCEGIPTLAPAGDGDGIDGYTYVTLRDVGPIEHAYGDVAIDEEGQPVAYRAALGDTMHAIASRFCIDYPGFLGLLNGHRRGEGDADLFRLRQQVWPGDIVNLDLHSITTVGTHNGQVLGNPLRYGIPSEQREVELTFGG